MRYNDNYIYYRELYSNQYYANSAYIEIILPNRTKKYLYFDKDNHIKFTNSMKYASKFSKKPQNYDKYVSYIKKTYPGANINYIEQVVIKNKY